MNRPALYLMTGAMVASVLVSCAARVASESMHLQHYSVEIDAYVRDEQALCERAWDVALERFGPGVAETVTRTHGVFDAVKCLSVLYQVDAPEMVVSAGIEVKRAN